MSTRAVIARATTEGFTGVYHHRDGYPSGLACNLWALYHGHFEGDLQAMCKTLIDDHPTGWSTIHGDWTLEPGFQEMFQGPCTVCGKDHWEHYYQYFASNGRDLTRGAAAKMAAGNYQALDHHFKEIQRPKPPECYCHGRNEPAWEVTQNNASGSGCEWAYVFDQGPVLVVLSSYRQDGQKMIGFFGAGDPAAKWVEVARIPLEGKEPDWVRVEGVRLNQPKQPEEPHQS